jgi:hypothetical protein
MLKAQGIENICGNWRKLNLRCGEYLLKKLMKASFILQNLIIEGGII